MRTAHVAIFLCVVGLLVALSAPAKDKPVKGREGQSEATGQHRDTQWEEKGKDPRGFSDGERERIHDYCERYWQQEGKHPRALPPGLAKKVARGGSLPPGWEHKCVRGEIMPVEVYRECRPLPPELIVKLPVPPVGTITVAVGGKVVRLLEATREILDVFNIHVGF